MKNIKYLLGLLSIVAIMTSCTTSQYAADENYDNEEARTQQVGNRLYIQDPYYGNVILERDPFTGRYYDVTYGYRYGTPYYGYGTYPYSGYRGYRRGYSVSGGHVQQQSTPSQQQIQQNREGARQSILGNSKH